MLYIMVIKTGSKGCHLKVLPSCFKIKFSFTNIRDTKFPLLFFIDILGVKTGIIG